jgi:hypothetical protein
MENKLSNSLDAAPNDERLPGAGTNFSRDRKYEP